MRACSIATTTTTLGLNPGPGTYLATHWDTANSWVSDRRFHAAAAATATSAASSSATATSAPAASSSSPTSASASAAASASSTRPGHDDAIHEREHRALLGLGESALGRAAGRDREPDPGRDAGDVHEDLGAGNGHGPRVEDVDRRDRLGHRRRPAGRVRQITASSGSLSAATTFSVVPGSADARKTTLSAAPAAVPANGSAISTVTVHVNDSAGNDLQSSAGAVALHTNLGTLSPATDLHNGTYTAALTAGTQPGQAVITGELGGQAIAGQATVTLEAQCIVPRVPREDTRRRQGRAAGLRIAEWERSRPSARPRSPPARSSHSAPRRDARCRPGRR